MRRTFQAGLIAAAVLLGATTGASAAERTLKFAYQNARTSPQSAGAERFAQLVGQKATGKLAVKVFPDGTLGGDTAVISSVQGGTIDITMVSTGNLVGMIKDFALPELPFVFNNYAEADAVLLGPVGKKLMEKLPEKGMVGLAYWDHGFRDLTNNKRAVAKLEDMEGIKVRVTPNPMYIDLFNTLGANAVPMAFTELYSALETHAMDGQENPPSMILTSKLGEVQKFMSTTRHAYNPLIILFSKKTWDKLDEANRRVLLEAAAEARTYELEINRKANQDALAELKQQGVTITEISDAERVRMREKVQPVLDKYKAQIEPALVQETFAQIDKVRASAKK